MKKAFTLFFLTALLIGGAVFAINGFAKHESFLDCNVEALTQTETNPTQTNCPPGWYASMALQLAEAHVVQTTCKISGKLSLFGYSAEGAYEKGGRYDCCVIRWSCINSVPQNCCDKDEQRVEVQFP